MKEETIIVLAIYPNPRGFGYVCIENANKLLDSGVVRVRPLNNDRILARIKRYVEYFRPALVVVRDCTHLTSPRVARIQSLIEDVAQHATEQNIPVYRYTRQQIRDVFEVFEATTKYEIAHRIVPWFPELAHRAPQIRDDWKDEEYHMGVFDAMALAITHRYLTE